VRLAPRGELRRVLPGGVRRADHPGAVIRQEPRGEVTHLTFVLPQDEPAGRVSVVGDFNDWTPGAHRMVKRSNGTRSVKVAVPAGQAFGFRYLTEDGHWFDDPAVEHRDWQNGLVLT
jgi:1,4-alpha-glucan branching enzyme